VELAMDITTDSDRKINRLDIVFCSENLFSLSEKKGEKGNWERNGTKRLRNKYIKEIIRQIIKEKQRKKKAKLISYNKSNKVN